MNSFTRRAAIAVAVLIVLAIPLWVEWNWKLFSRWVRPTPLPDLERDGGTLLVYEFAGKDLPEDFDPNELVVALLDHLDITRDRGIMVRMARARRVEIGIPHPPDQAPPDHEEEVQRVKQLLAESGELEFRIVANTKDDDLGIAEAQYLFREVVREPGYQQQLAERAPLGLPPPPPRPAEGDAFETPKGRFTYQWVELAPSQRATLGLDSPPPGQSPDDVGPGRRGEELREKAAAARKENQPFLTPEGWLMYSRTCQDVRLSEQARAQKQFDCFLLCRDPEKDPATGKPKVITGRHLLSVTEGRDRNMLPAITFSLTAPGGELLFDLTSRNATAGGAAKTNYCHIAVLVDGRIVSAPTLNEPIRQHGQISGHFTWEEVQYLVNILRAGALPVPLKPVPVSETTVTPK